ncbi:MAG: AAA family ATPase [Gomphosphaeria aponina SAG 52.96 = DSM 107014]|uniref:AAA family ATPase n=1 Tax=Gomphosphaeria aponina SAG 52.96 = DSM 107014 TaxID=1521640 RepID=A0A941JUS2_9CHRO|nr:AAA family ATPase [Gomphosphaeria aponina SAG 52.96 = DSM 107014]
MQQKKLIEQMQQAHFYPHSVQNSIKGIQTHISYVLLTGNYAYKIKKAVNFGFLDFSTLAKRKFFLEEELRLNKQNAPEIYLEVLPITKIGEIYRLNGRGETQEYVLKMRQFSQDDLLSRMLEQGKLTTKHLEDLGKMVALFHEKSQTNDEIKSFGTGEKIKASIDDNYGHTAKYIGITQSQQQYEETKRFTDNFLSEKKEIFSSRRENNKIKECHGDLHLKNICWWQNKIQLFDRIEFNEEFRFIDVIADVAFTVMDLEARGFQELGNVFLNTYLENTGDWEGVQVLPLYLCRQAYVRAKVFSLMLDEGALSEQEKEKVTKTAVNYYQLAWKYTLPKQGKLILMSGLSGAGKSTVAEEIAKKSNGIKIRSDAVRKHLGGMALEEHGGNELYTPAMSEKTYNRLLALGIILASQGWVVILDGKYDRQIWRERAYVAAEVAKLSLEIIHCTAPMGVLRDRLAQRTGDISDATVNLLTEQQTAAEPFTEAERKYVTTIDTTQDWSTQLNFGALLN